MWRSGSECGKPLDNVGKTRIVGDDTVEETTRLDHIAHSIMQIGDHIPLAQMMFRGALDLGGLTREHRERLLQPTLISEGSGIDDARFGHQFRIRTELRYLFPQFRHSGVVAQGSMTVRKHRMVEDPRRVQL